MAGTITRLTRRSAMGLIGASGIATALVSQSAAAAPPAAALPPAPPATNGVPAALRPGAPFGRWTVVEVHPVAQGALRVDVRPSNEPEGHVFALEILARDPAPASLPPATVGSLAVFVPNGGNGWLPTVEEQGLAAMTLAALLEKHGQTGPIEGLMTFAERVIAHGDVLSAVFVDADGCVVDTSA
jgi:hypothetical protein